MIENMKSRLLGNVAFGQCHARDRGDRRDAGAVSRGLDRLHHVWAGRPHDGADHSPGRKAATTDAERARLQTTMLSYAGQYLIEPDAVVHRLDVAWNPDLVGKDQRRYVTFEGNRLILKGAPGPSAVDGVVARATITWEKVG